MFKRFTSVEEVVANRSDVAQTTQVQGAKGLAIFKKGYSDCPDVSQWAEINTFELVETVEKEVAYCHNVAKRSGLHCTMGRVL